MTITQQKLIHALNNEVRLAILETLKSGSKNVTELTEKINSSQSNISQHLACLRDCKLITQNRRGKYYYYQLATPEITHLLAEMDLVIKSLNWKNNEVSVACKSDMP
ncbi:MULTISPECIES: metalloregulator ArsR/SmtB family transcription factor [Pediococcus]|jgi:DNA-binding transcriptional ArsR family regulator|uniref:Metalloregulator ArsR/SmtB family transcription factor n=1 Tax=Pediococcus parvulus TaxID=54062 RepID=A0A176TLH0_9LACO|nr:MULTISPECIES: metalloregulator ArsR/SmtB family transcription factor [Pediococcus]MCT3027926.1 ArsR family transcriptional regulator [Pediococcus parvulus]MCT3029863.1 ArsR family transcriptional regulator [Pediococcus parvulus]MCT3030660.1 ArsR family transcriptional regulator [Pediococcus parvulus]MCT3034261.1 ArsR family transcriptional regulator [Pediococcus parvulus]MDN5574861.1 metalloregulator ArsR/SmtB family transcription factor [Pediococcus sp.]